MMTVADWGDTCASSRSSRDVALRNARRMGVVFTNMIESRIDFALHTIMVRIGEEWLDVRHVDGHRGLHNAAWVMHNRATEAARLDART
jgi:hypothetical protein